MGTDDVPNDIDHLEVWLVDDDPAVNPNLAFVLRDVAETIGNLRDEENRVFVHCVRAESRTPAAAAAFLALRFELSGRDALAFTDGLIPGPGPKPRFKRTLQELFPAE
jgi:ADP-ribosyl-[dinitrogen reductase] hydrolase